jgi:hypothetical protein
LQQDQTWKYTPALTQLDTSHLVTLELIDGSV